MLHIVQVSAVVLFLSPFLPTENAFLARVFDHASLFKANVFD